MKLSADVFDRVLAALGDGIPTAQANERRTARRMGLRASADVWLADNGSAAKQSVAVRDVSNTGVSLLLHVPLRPGRLLALELARLDDQPLRLVCEVRRCLPVSGDLYVVGLAYRKRASATQLPQTAAPPSAVSLAPAPARDPRTVGKRIPATMEIGNPAPAAVPDHQAAVLATGSPEIERIRAAILGPVDRD